MDFASPASSREVSGNPQLVQTIFGNPGAVVGLIIAQLGAVIGLFVADPADQRGDHDARPILYAGLTGLTLSSIFLIYTFSPASRKFSALAFAFAGLSGFSS